MVQKVFKHCHASKNVQNMLALLKINVTLLSFQYPFPNRMLYTLCLTTVATLGSKSMVGLKSWVVFESFELFSS